MLHPTSVMAFPLTSGLSSFSNRHVSSARYLPSDDSSKKKLTPRSASSTMPESRIVNSPIPGKTRFFSVSIPVTPGVLLMRRICVSSSATCPVAPYSTVSQSFTYISQSWQERLTHNRSCRSYRFSFALGRFCSGAILSAELVAISMVKVKSERGCTCNRDDVPSRYRRVSG